MNKVCILRKIRTKIDLKCRGVRDATMIQVMTTLVKKREIGV